MVLNLCTSSANFFFSVYISGLCRKQIPGLFETEGKSFITMMS